MFSTVVNLQHVFLPMTTGLCMTEVQNTKSILKNKFIRGGLKFDFKTP